MTELRLDATKNVVVVVSLGLAIYVIYVAFNIFDRLKPEDKKCGCGKNKAPQSFKEHDQEEVRKIASYLGDTIKDKKRNITAVHEKAEKPTDFPKVKKRKYKKKKK